MKHAFLIIALSNPDYVDSLINRLRTNSSDRTTIYIHVDIKSLDLFKSLINKYENAENIKFISKYGVHWGGYQIIETEKLLLELALENESNFYFHLLSDADYLCRPLNELINFFDNPKNQNKEYIECAPVKKYGQQNVSVRDFIAGIYMIGLTPEDGIWDYSIVI